VNAERVVVNLAGAGPSFTLPAPPLAKGFSDRRRFMKAFGHQFDAVLGVKLEGLGDGCPRVVNAIRHGVGHREI
jgi:hypothetical protein